MFLQPSLAAPLSHLEMCNVWEVEGGGWGASLGAPEAAAAAEAGERDGMEEEDEGFVVVNIPGA